MSHRKTITLLISLLVIMAIFPKIAHPNLTEKKFNISAHLSFSKVLKTGSNDDYEPGENDFPITAAHNDFGYGLSLDFNLAKRFSFQLSTDIITGSTVRKEDPTDGETYDYKTYNSINVLGTTKVKFGSNFPFFIIGGGGLNILRPYSDKEVSGSFGSIIILEAPDAKTNLMAALGVGAFLSQKTVILKLEALYTRIFKSKKNSVLFRLGFGF
ncbi:outer membrane beta-barrel protein [Acidobacteriota bacterium]